MPPLQSQLFNPQMRSGFSFSIRGSCCFLSPNGIHWCDRFGVYLYLKLNQYLLIKEALNSTNKLYPCLPNTNKKGGIFVCELTIWGFWNHCAVFFVTCSVPNTLPLQQVDLLFCTPPPADKRGSGSGASKKIFWFSLLCCLLSTEGSYIVANKLGC